MSKVNHVIHISIDGLRGDLLESLVSEDPGNYSNFRRFVTEGATTFNARNDYTDTSTLPNHTAILTARPVAQPEGGPSTAHHGYLDNSDPSPSTTLHNGGNENLSYVPSVFDVVHDAGLSTALYGSKGKFVIYDRSYDAPYLHFFRHSLSLWTPNCPSTSSHSLLCRLQPLLHRLLY